MIFTPDTSTHKAIRLAGLALVLRPVSPSDSAIPLCEWLDNDSFMPFWVPLVPKRNTIKVMPILPSPELYPELLQSVCRRLTQVNIIAWQERHYEIIGVETQTDNLFVIQLSLLHRQALPPTLNRAVHGLCLQWFANANLEIAEQLHQAAVSPFTVSIQSKNRHQTQVRVAVLQAELFSLLLWGLCPNLGQEISLANAGCQVGPQIQLVASSSFEKLVQTTPQDALKLEFVTPTSFKQEDAIQPFPLPELVFAGLLRRWNTFAPDGLKLDRQNWTGWVTAFDLKTHTLRMKSDEIGSQGWVRYRFPDPEQARIATILAHFAFFAGVGRKTAMGMGQTRLLNHHENDRQE
jgi:CRISPR-associated endoribonuclease Cas6